MDKEIVQKCIDALEAAIQKNGTNYALNKMTWVRYRLRKELEE